MNVERILGHGPKSPWAIAFKRNCLHHQAAMTAEGLRAVQTPHVVAMENWNELRENTTKAEAAGIGVVLITAHVGSWELCPYYTAKALQAPLYALAKRPRMRSLRKPVEALRQQAGMETIWTGGPNLFDEMSDLLRRGNNIGFVMDQRPRAPRGHPVNFFGQITPFAEGPGTLAAKHHCPVVSMFVVRTSPWHYRTVSRMLLPPHHGVNDPAAITQMCAAEIERVIREFPEQWTWNYKRWKWSESRTAPAAELAMHTP